MNHDELVKIYMDRFVNQTVIWGKQWVSSDKQRSGYAYQKPDMDTRGGWFLYEPLTPALIRRHFAGNLTVGLTAIDEQCCSKWLLFDSDTDDGDLIKLAYAARLWGMHIIPEGRREGRAGRSLGAI